MITKVDVEAVKEIMNFVFHAQLDKKLYYLIFKSILIHI